MKKNTIIFHGTEIELTEHEVEIVRFFAKHYIDKGDDIVVYDDLPRSKEMNRNDLIRSTDRLETFGLFLSHSSSTARIPPLVLDVVQQWDNPPLPDYRDKITKWFWSKPWSVPVLVIVVGIPVIIEWIKLVKFIVEWFSTTYKP